jgi:hypothetical protein
MFSTDMSHIHEHCTMGDDGFFDISMHVSVAFSASHGGLDGVLGVDFGVFTRMNGSAPLPRLTGRV